MSIVLVRKESNKIIIGADSQESSGESNQENIINCKLRQVKQDIFLAGVGNAHVVSLFYSYVEKHLKEFEKINNKFKLVEFVDEFSKWMKDILEPAGDGIPLLATCQFIIILNGKVWLFNNFYIREIEDGEYSAIGSGIQAALACINVTSDFEKILKSVCKVDIYCSEPIIIKEIQL